MSTSRIAREWGPAAVATVCVVLALAAGMTFGGFLGWATLTGDVFLTWRVLGWSAWVVAVAADLVFIATVACRLYRARGTR